MMGACRAVNATLSIKCKMNSFHCDHVRCAILSKACALVCNRNQKQKKRSLAEATAALAYNRSDGIILPKNYPV